MTSEWPIKAGARGRRSGLVPRIGRIDDAAERLADAALDLTTPPAHRLGDGVRASAASMIDRLIGATERDMRRLVVPAFDTEPELSASLASASVAIAAPILADARTLGHEPFVALVLRRVEEAMLADRLTLLGWRTPERLIDDADSRIASAATAMLVADRRRRDRFGGPVLLFDDLSAELAHWLAWRIAAALRHYIVVRHEVDVARADAALIGAVGSVLRAHDDGRGLHATASHLATALDDAGRLHGRVVVHLLGDANVTAFTACVAMLARLPAPEAWGLIASPADGRCATLLRAAGVDRACAAELLLMLLNDDAPDALAVFEGMTAYDAQAMVAPLALDSEYRAAVRALDSGVARGDLR